MNDRLRIQNFLTRLAKESKFPTVKYDAETGEAAFLDSTQADCADEKPKSAVCNEISGLLTPDARRGRVVAQKLESWNFELHLEFGNEVSLDEFRNLICDQVPALPPENGFHAALMRLTSFEVTHPVQQSPDHGTKAVFTFAVQLIT